MRTANFNVDPSKCTGCGKCVEVCPGNLVGADVIHMRNSLPEMTNQSKFGWRGCWRCQHCMAVCPEGAVSVLGVSADDAPKRPDASTADEMTRLVQYRRTCRTFRKEDVDPRVINQLINAMGAVPTGGNSYGLQFSVVESRRAMQRLYKAVFPYQQMNLFDTGSGINSGSQNNEPEDMHKLAIYNAPHLFMAHKVVGRRFHDGDLTELGVATAYFELLANAYGLGTVITNYGAEQILKSREARQLLEIPEDHTALAIVGFGYPQYEYQRGVVKRKRVHRLK